MKLLCIDVGNTSTHYGIVEGQTVIESGHLPTRQLHTKPSPEFIHSLATQVEGIACCSVVPEINAHLLAAAHSTRLPVFHLTHLNCRGLNLAYPKPEEIGQDRIANAIAAQEYYGIPTIILDMGTAITLDVVSRAGYEGGIIAPGLEVMTRYLHEQTALLPKLKEDDLLHVEGIIGKSTIHAMKLGVSIGFSGMVDALLACLLNELSRRNEPTPKILATGGSISSLTKEWVKKSHFIEDLTLIGLAVAFIRQL